MERNKRPLPVDFNFFRALEEISNKVRVLLTIPETFIMGFGFKSPCLFCTDYSTGQLVIRGNVTQGGVLDSCSFFEQLACFGKHPIAIHKFRAGGRKGDTCNPLYTPQDCSQVWSQSIFRQQPIMLQRFVMPNKNYIILVKAKWDKCSDIVQKTAYKKAVTISHSQTGYNIRKLLGNRREIVDFSTQKPYQIVQKDICQQFDIPNSQLLDSKMAYIVKLLEKYYFTDVIIESLRANFIRDDKGFLYLINVKDMKVIRKCELPSQLPSLWKGAKSSSLQSIPIQNWDKALEKKQQILNLAQAVERRKKMTN